MDFEVQWGSFKNWQKSRKIISVVKLPTPTSIFFAISASIFKISSSRGDPEDFKPPLTKIPKEYYIRHENSKIQKYSSIQVVK